MQLGESIVTRTAQLCDKRRMGTKRGRVPSLVRRQRLAWAAAWALVLPIVFSGCYLPKQAYYLAGYYLRDRSIRSVKKKTSDNSLREFLTLAQSIKRFAVDSIGLSDDRNYTTYVETGRKHLVDVVMGSLPDTFELYKWCYPIVGCVEYKGFFDPRDARRQAARLKRKGYETYQWPSDAFSTLGILRDPLYSHMRDYTAFELASLIIHEQTHATLYIRGEAQFNEELASFVGEQGGLAFIAATRGDSSGAFHDATVQLGERRRFQAFIRVLRARLDSLYQSPFSRDRKLARKKEIIAASRQTFEESYDSWFTTGRYRFFADVNVNNAYIAALSLYNEDLGLYYRLYELDGRDLRRTVQELLTADTSSVPPKEYLERLVEQHAEAQEGA
jgi:predicted aminopeptidase